MSRASLWAAIVGAVHGLNASLSRLHDSPFTEHAERGVPLENAGRTRAFELAVDSGVRDTGLVDSGALDMAEEDWALRSLYRGAAEPDAADWGETIQADTVDIVNAIRDPDLWATLADDVSVIPGATIEEIQTAEGPIDRISSVRMTVRYIP